jgi:hypothetical protein
MAFSFFSVAVAVYGLSFTLPTIIDNMGFTAANAQLLSIPPYVFACFCVIPAQSDSCTSLPSLPTLVRANDRWKSR